MRKAMSEFGGSFIWRPCLLHLNRFNSLHLPASAVCSPLLQQMMHSWEWQWPYEFDPAPFLFFLSWKSHTILQRVKHIWSFKRNSLISWKHFCEPFHTSSTWLSNPFERAQCFSIDSVRLGVYTWNITTAKLTSTVSYMIALSHKRAPTPYFWCNFLYRVKVYSNESPPWSELCVAFEKHSLKHYASGSGTEIRLEGLSWEAAKQPIICAKCLRAKVKNWGG